MHLVHATLPFPFSELAFPLGVFYLTFGLTVVQKDADLTIKSL